MRPLPIINQNGILSDKKRPKDDNAQLRLLETMRSEKGKVPLFEGHYQRISKGLAHWGLSPRDFPSPRLYREIKETLRANSAKGEAMVRLTISVSPINKGIGFVLELYPLPPTLASLSLGLYPLAKAPAPLDHLKTTDRGYWEQALRWGHEHAYDDVLVTNAHGSIVESTRANLFWTEGDILFTPHLAEGCVAGVMREWLFQQARKQGWPLMERATAPDQLETCQGIFLSNAVRGIMPVRRFQGRALGTERYEHWLECVRWASMRWP